MSRHYNDRHKVAAGDRRGMPRRLSLPSAASAPASLLLTLSMRGA